MKFIMKEEFDYKKAVEELEAIAAKVEDPQTGVGDIDREAGSQGRGFRAPGLGPSWGTSGLLPLLPSWST